MGYIFRTIHRNSPLYISLKWFSLNANMHLTFHFLVELWVMRFWLIVHRKSVSVLLTSNGGQSHNLYSSKSAFWNAFGDLSRSNPSSDMTFSIIWLFFRMHDDFVALWPFCDVSSLRSFYHGSAPKCYFWRPGKSSETPPDGGWPTE